MAPFSLFTLKILVLMAGSPTLLAAFLLAKRRARRVLPGLFILLVLLSPPSLLVERGEQFLESIFQVLLPEYRPVEPLPWWGDPLSILLFFLPVIVISAGLIMAVVLWLSGLKSFRERAGAHAARDNILAGAQKQQRRFPGADLFLSGLVLAATLYSLYWLMLWDNTTDSIGIIWLFMMLPAVLICCLLLVSRSTGMVRTTGLFFAVLIPASLIGLSFLAYKTDYRALTERRAARVSQAIEAYQARTGHYPQDLGQLAPCYLLSLPGPLIINGQGWCYQASEAGYRIGFVDRDHWSSPELFGHLTRQGGDIEDLPGLCADQIAAIKAERGW